MGRVTGTRTHRRRNSSDYERTLRHSLSAIWAGARPAGIVGGQDSPPGSTRASSPPVEVSCACDAAQDSAAEWPNNGATAQLWHGSGGSLLPGAADHRNRARSTNCSESPKVGGTALRWRHTHEHHVVAWR